jgi:hypothetical protein
MAGACSALPETLYPGLHLVVPLVQSVESYDLRDQIYETTIVADIKKGEHELFATKCDEVRRAAALTIAQKLVPNAVILKEVMLRET